MTRLTRVIGFLAVLALLLGLLLPLVGAAAQETNGEEDVATTEALSEVPSTGARRPGPVILAATRVAAPEPEPEPVEGVAPVELQVDSVGVDAPIELGAVVDGVMQDPSGPWVVSWYSQLRKDRPGRGMSCWLATSTIGMSAPPIFQGISSLQLGRLIRVVGEDGEISSTR